MGIIDTDTKWVWHPFDVMDLPHQVYITKARGVYLYTSDGRKIIDAISSWWVNLHGHRNPHISKAVSRQLRQVAHVMFAGFTHKPAVELATLLMQLVPGKYAKVFYSDNGSTAVEVALKMAIQYWYNKGEERKLFLAFEGAYHGDTFGAMAAGDRNVFSKPFAKHLFDVRFVPFPSKNIAPQEYLDQFAETVKTHKPAAFIFEPLVQGSAGMRMYDADILQKLLNICNEHQVLTIADEVMTGFGRTGTLFAMDRVSAQAHLLCLSKGITGGYLPLGATLCTENIWQAFDQKQLDKIFFHGHSYTANPLACAAACASIKLLLSADCKQQIQRITESHQNFVQSVSTLPQVQEARSLGTILAVEIKNHGETSYFNALRNRLYCEFMQKNILLRPLGNVVYCMPPYIITPQQLQRVYHAMHEVIEKL